VREIRGRYLRTRKLGLILLQLIILVIFTRYYEPRAEAANHAFTKDESSAVDAIRSRSMETRLEPDRSAGHYRKNNDFVICGVTRKMQTPTTRATQLSSNQRAC